MQLDWISVDDELPIPEFTVYVKNGKRIVEAKYYRKKWYWWDRNLHNVTHWAKDPVTYPKIPRKDMNAYMKRANQLRGQMQKRNFVVPRIFLI
jgi:hypothetical protein